MHMHNKSSGTQNARAEEEDLTDPAVSLTQNST